MYTINHKIGYILFFNQLLTFDLTIPYVLNISLLHDLLLLFVDFRAIYTLWHVTSKLQN